MKKIALFIFFAFVGNLFAQLPQRPEPERLYNNLSKQFPDFLSQSEASQIENKLEQFSNETSNQICVLVVDDLAGFETADYSIRLANDWGIGKKGVNNGVLILIKPTQQDGGRDLFIAVGYGLEGAIPDLATKRIREEQMYPNLKAGRNFDAINEATDVLMKLAKGEINVKDYTRQHSSRPSTLKTIFIIVILIIILLVRIFRGGGGGGYTYSRGGRNIFWGSGMGGSGWGGGSSWGGGLSGGGWGGFGGGGFGGGGSGGKW